MPRRAGGKSSSKASASASSVMEKLRAELLQALSATIADTVDTVCEEHEQGLASVSASSSSSYGPSAISGFGALNGNSATVHTANGVEGVSYDLYYAYCQQLVAYIATNMATSPDFVQQMDRIILACHSNASESVLRSVVTKSLWFHRHEEAESEADEPMMPTRATSSPPPREAPRSGKRRATRAVKAPVPTPKRARKDGRATRHTTYTVVDSNEEEEEDEGDEDMRQMRRSTRRRQNRVFESDDEPELKRNPKSKPTRAGRRSMRSYRVEEDTKNVEEEDEEDDEDDEDVEIVEAGVKGKEPKPKQPHYESHVDELLSFKDAIGDMCYADRRTPAQTRFFKERLRKAIEFVDAQLCHPPAGQACSWQCKKIRSQMCSENNPCRSKLCRMWHDVEAHTDNCHNTHCEFRIRVMLRETMHKIDSLGIEIQNYRSELQTKKRELTRLKRENEGDREVFVETRLLENEIVQLEQDLDKSEKDLGVFKATKKAYWATLNEIGLTEADDENDKFPPFNAHYVLAKKKTTPKKRTPTKAPKNDEYAPSTATHTERGRRRSVPVQSSESEEKRTVTIADGPRRRITRRSTQQSQQAMTDGVIDVGEDVDEETKIEQDTSADEDEKYAYRPPAEDQEDKQPVATGDANTIIESETTGGGEVAAESAPPQVAESANIGVLTSVVLEASELTMQADTAAAGSDVENTVNVVTVEPDVVPESTAQQQNKQAEPLASVLGNAHTESIRAENDNGAGDRELASALVVESSTASITQDTDKNPENNHPSGRVQETGNEPGGIAEQSMAAALAAFNGVVSALGAAHPTP